MRTCGWMALLATLIAGCAEENRVRSQEAIVPYPEIDFDPTPDYIPDNVVVLTFDDGPDWNNTARVLDVLRDKDAKATFFINTENWSNVNTDGPMRDLVRRMVNEGHELASHSAKHQHMGTLTADAIEAELSGVEATVNDVIGAGAPRMTLFRAPFGEPYQGNDPNWPNAGYQKVAPVVAKHAVHIGWAIDSFDYNCAGSAACVVTNVKNAINEGKYGVMLFHSVHAQTAESLPEVIDFLQSKGMVFWTVEDVVRARYGKSSAEIVDQGGGGDGGDDGGDGAAA